MRAVQVFEQERAGRRQLGVAEAPSVADMRESRPPSMRE